MGRKGQRESARTGWNRWPKESGPFVDGPVTLRTRPTRATTLYRVLSPNSIGRSSTSGQRLPRCFLTTSPLACGSFWLELRWVGSLSRSRPLLRGLGNSIWRLLYDAGFTPARLTPDDDATLPNFGIGLMDLVKSVAQSHDRGLTEHHDVPGFAAKIAKYQPTVVAFTSREAGTAVARTGVSPLGWCKSGS